MRRRAEIHFSEWNINQYYFTWTGDSYTFHGCFKEDTYFLLLLITDNFLLENHHIQHLTTRWQPAPLLTSKRSACKERKKKNKTRERNKKKKKKGFSSVNSTLTVWLRFLTPAVALIEHFSVALWQLASLHQRVKEVSLPPCKLIIHGSTSINPGSHCAQL